MLDLTEDELVVKFAAGVSMVSSLALAISYPTIAAVPHMILNSYKNALSIAIATQYSFPQADKVKEYLKVYIFFALLFYLLDHLCSFLNLNLISKLIRIALI